MQKPEGISDNNIVASIKLMKHASICLINRNKKNILLPGRLLSQSLLMTLVQTSKNKYKKHIAKPATTIC